MIAKYGLKSLEYLFYAVALLPAWPLVYSGFVQPFTQTDLAAIIFLLIGLGVLLPRAIAYVSWPKVVARVGPYRGTWDGEQSARYTYKVGDQDYARSFRAMFGTDQILRLQVCVNPHAPWIGYPVFWNVWLFGAAMTGLGVFLLFSDGQYFG